MSPILDGVHLSTPATLADVLAELAADPAARPFAGGTDLMVLLEAGHLPEGRYVSLARCGELRGIVAGEDGVAIGAMTTYTDILSSDLLRAGYPMLSLAAAETGSLATQNRGTIGGNIANASPAADTPPALLVYDAELEMASSHGSRRLPYAHFHRAYKQMDLAPGEIIRWVRLPPRTGWRDYYRKVGTRRAQAIAKIGFAGAVRMDGRIVEDVRLALGSVGPTVIRASHTESVLRGRPLDGAAIAAAVAALESDIVPIDDIRSNALYRRRVAGNLLREFLTA